MELPITLEETFEDEAVNNVDNEYSNADSAADEVLLQLTVDDDFGPVHNSSTVISYVTVTTESSFCQTGCSKNMLSASLVQNSCDRRPRKRQISAVAAAQAQVFRQYLLDGNVQARIIELDVASTRGGASSLWGKLVVKMYGEYTDQLLQRMWIAWRRQRPGSIRDRVLSSLQSDGLLTHSNSWTLSASRSKSQPAVDSSADVEQQCDASVSNGCCVSDLLHTKLVQKSDSTALLTQQTLDGASDLELDDVDIQKALDILKSHCSVIAGLEHVGLGTCIRSRSVPRFAAAGNRRFVQIVNVGDHWVCATNLFGKTTSDVYVYDSLFSHVSHSLVVQISSILRLDDSSSSITFHIREFKQQKPGTRLCGYYAVAAAFAVCSGTDPTGTVYPMDLLHKAVKRYLEAGSFGLVPASDCKLKRDVQTLTKQRLFCVCYKRAIGLMVRCERCYNQFHASCIVPFQLPFTSDGQLERGPCCARVADDAV